jgi:nanoRNase/pAp phosphatase (c-di-AMP/oligoRNAs hydrolase)
MSEFDSNELFGVTEKQLRSFRSALSEGPVIILAHNNPDPDALASGAGLACLISEVWGIQTRLAYSGLVGRAENKVMMEILTPGWQPVDSILDINSYSCFVLVDAQPETGNSSLPPPNSLCAVIDHHPLRKSLGNIPYIDIRTDFGATSSLVYKYLEAARYQPDPRLATALFYGIQTDTQGLSRHSSASDR